MFLGYTKESKAYKLWDRDLRRIVFSRDVMFEETECGCNGNIEDAKVEVEGDGEFCHAGT